MLLYSFSYDTYRYDNMAPTWSWMFTGACLIIYVWNKFFQSAAKLHKALSKTKVTQPGEHLRLALPFPSECGRSVAVSLTLPLPDTLAPHCCPQHLRGAVTNCPRKSLCGPCDPPFIFPDSNLVLALLHTCHGVFFLTLEAGGKRTVINGATRAGHGSFIIVW